MQLMHFLNIGGSGMILSLFIQQGIKGNNGISQAITWKRMQLMDFLNWRNNGSEMTLSITIQLGLKGNNAINDMEQDAIDANEMKQ